MKRPVFSWIYRMIGMFVGIALIYSCQAVTLQQAQSEWNNGVMLENSKVSEFDLIYPDAHYRKALELLDKVDSTGDNQLDISKDVLTALCYWRIADYKKADDLVQILKHKASEAAPRDQVLIYLLPALIKIDEAKAEIPLEPQINEVLLKELNQKVDEALKEIKNALMHVESPMLRIYVLETGLEAYNVRKLAHNKLATDLNQSAFNSEMKREIKNFFIDKLPTEIGESWKKTLGIRY